MEGNTEARIFLQTLQYSILTYICICIYIYIYDKKKIKANEKIVGEKCSTLLQQGRYRPLKNIKLWTLKVHYFTFYVVCTIIRWKIEKSDLSVVIMEWCNVTCWMEVHVWCCSQMLLQNKGKCSLSLYIYIYIYHKAQCLRLCVCVSVDL